MRHRGLVAPINTIKHYVPNDNADIASATKREIPVVTSVGQASVTNTQDVVEGSIVKAVFIEQWIKSEATSGNNTKFQLLLEKVPAGATPVTFAQMNTLMGYLNKKNVLFFSQGIMGDLTTAAIPIVRNWFKIPKGKQRMGLGDEIVVSISANGFIINNCGFSVFKEYK